MNERDLRDLIGRVKAGGLSRRIFLQRMATAGLAAPLAAQLLAQSGVAMAQSRPVAGSDLAQSAFRGRQQGPRGDAAVL
jgi:hypothetical protein